MMFTITPSLESQALELAYNLRFSPETRQRISHTEKMWRYRPYQGGEPASKIDWRQSARCNKIYVRKHEAIISRDIYFWAGFENAEDMKEKTTLILLALAHILVKKERAVGWLNPHLIKTTTSALVTHLVENGLSSNEAPLMPVRQQFIILAANLAPASPELQNSIKTYIAQENRGLLLHIEPNNAIIHKDEQIIKTAKNAGWPLLILRETSRHDEILVHLLEKTIEGTR